MKLCRIVADAKSRDYKHSYCVRVKVQISQQIAVSDLDTAVAINPM